MMLWDNRAICPIISPCGAMLVSV